MQQAVESSSRPSRKPTYAHGPQSSATDRVSNPGNRAQRKVNLFGIYTAGGALERPLDASGWRVPAKMWVEGDSLRYSATAGGGSWQLVHPHPGILESFIRLAEAPAERILQFARRFGILGLKKATDKPKSNGYANLDEPYGDDYGYSVLEIPEISEGRCGEPLRNWRFWARKFDAALRIASAFTEGRYAPAECWHVIFSGKYGPPAPGYRCPSPEVTDKDIFEGVRAEFYGQIETWLRLGNVGLRIDGWEGPTLAFGTDALFSGLVLQLAAACCGSDGFAMCSCCNTPYAPTRQPVAGKRHYCRECGRRAAVRAAVRAHRDRQRVKVRKSAG